MRYTLVSLVASAFALSGCGGGATSSGTDFASQIVEFEQSLSALSTQPFSNAISSSDASGTYTGSSLLQVVVDNETEVFIGTSTLTVDIGAESVSGSLSEFSGLDKNGEIEGLQGSLTLTGISVSVDESGEFESALTGRLESSNTSIEISNTSVFGEFLNDPTTALSASGRISDTTFNGMTGLTSFIDIQAMRN